MRSIAKRILRLEKAAEAKKKAAKKPVPKKQFGRPLHDRVLVRRKATEQVTAAGVIIPDNAQEEAVQGTVLAVGEGSRDGVALTPPAVKPGDVIAFGKYAGSEIVIDGEKLLILREEEIHLVLESA